MENIDIEGGEDPKFFYVFKHGLSPQLAVKESIRDIMNMLNYRGMSFESKLQLECPALFDPRNFA